MFDIRLAHVEPVLGLEPLSVGVEKRDQSDRNATGLSRNEHEIVEGLLVRCVENHEFSKRLRSLNRPRVGRTGAQAQHVNVLAREAATAAPMSQPHASLQHRHLRR